MVGWTEMRVLSLVDVEVVVSLRLRKELGSAVVEMGLSVSAGGGWWMLPFVRGGSEVAEEVYMVDVFGGEVVDVATCVRCGL